MALPRSKYVREGEIGTYHCTTRCVRRAYLSGFDAYSGRDYSHRKVWIEDRLRQLASVFAVDISSFSIMDNHYHVTLRTRPDIVDNWSDYEVARRWLILCPVRFNSEKKNRLPVEEHIHNLALLPERIAELRKRLSSLSWFMGKLNEYIARTANKEDGVKGRFWESRFKCQALLDDAAVAACMVYVDLNPIRAGIAANLEESNFTGVQQRIRAHFKEKSVKDSPTNSASSSECWLCPIPSHRDPNGILPITEKEYFNLLDSTGRLVRSDKRGAMNPELAPILLRIGAKSDSWAETASRFEEKFSVAVGHTSNMRNYANRLGRRWLVGLSESQNAFISQEQSS